MFFERVLEADWSITCGMQSQSASNTRTKISVWTYPNNLIFFPPNHLSTPCVPSGWTEDTTGFLTVSVVLGSWAIDTFPTYNVPMFVMGVPAFITCASCIYLLFLHVFPLVHFLRLIVFSTANPINPEQNLPFPYMNNQCNPPTVPPRDVLLCSFCPAADL